MKKEQFAIYEREPVHGKEKNGVILAPYDNKEEAEQARIKYGYNNDNYYVDKVLEQKKSVNFSTYTSLFYFLIY